MSTRNPSRRRSALLLVGTALLAAGCASPGPPRPPSLQLPEAPADLAATRRGPFVELAFTPPARTTDGFAVTGPVYLSVCRAVGSSACVPVIANVLINTAGKGPTTVRDLLPPELLQPPAQLLRYEAAFFNARGRTAGSGDPVFAASGPAPAPVAGFRAASSRDGVTLRWQAESGAPTGVVLLDRHGPPTHKESPKPPAEPVKPHHKQPLPTIATLVSEASRTGDLLLRAVPASAEPLAQDPGGSIDASAIPGTPYTYTAFRSRTITVGAHTLKLLSEATAPLAITLADSFAPLPPRGLTAAAYTLDDANTAVDLIWQPNTESDLAGYLVFRRIIASGASAASPPEQLTPAPVTSPAFHDRALPPGARARYTVVAVDVRGNRSDPSAPAEAP